MIKDLLWIGQRLAGRSDARLTHGIAWCVLEGLFAAAMYLPLCLLLQALGASRLTPLGTVMCAVAMLTCLGLRITAGRIAMPKLFAGTYSLMGDARLRMADHLRRLPMGWFSHQRAGDLGARLTSDLELVEHLWSHFLGTCISGLAMPVFLILMVWWVDWRLGVVVLAGLPLALVALVLTQHVVVRPGTRLMQASANAQSALLEYVQGIAVIRCFGRFGDAWARLTAALQEQHAALIDVETRPAPWLMGYGFLLEAGYVSLVCAAAWWLEQGTLSPISLVTILVLALPVYRQLFDLGLALMMLRFSRRALQRIGALLEEPTLPEPQQPRIPHGHDLELEDVCFAYDGEKTLALDSVSCRIPARGLTAVVGPSGAGKSTLVHLVARLWDVRQGSIRMGGIDIREMGTQALHEHVAMVFQDVVLFSGTVLDNLRLARPGATRNEVVESARRAQAHAFIEALPQGYDTVLDEGGTSLSGGERQRLSIARALLKDAPILLLDEATASIDPSSEADVQRAFAELARGRTVVMIAHRLQSVRHADQILVLDAGQLVESGCHEALLNADGLYAHLWSRQASARQWILGACSNVGDAQG